MPFTLDIKTRQFGSEETIYRLFPGRDYTYFNIMRRYGIVFMDLPGIPMPETHGYSKSNSILESLVRAEARSSIVSACQKMDICLYPKNKWRFKIAKNFDVR